MRLRTISRASRLFQDPVRRRQAAALAGGSGLAVALMLGALVGAGISGGRELIAGLAILAIAGAIAGGLAGLAAVRTAESARQVRNGFWIDEKCEPLNVRLSGEAPTRINIIHPSIDLKHFFGGFIAVFNLAVRLRARGHRVRVIALERSDLPRDWRDSVGAYEGIGDSIHQIEVEVAAPRSRPVTFSAKDSLIATHWTAAHVAAAALPSLEADRFLYLIQEYEPFTFPMGSAAALARASYDLPHTALFSTGLLAEWFAAERIGVFRESDPPGEQLSATFENAITPVGPSSADSLDRPGPRRLAFYARPEQHAARNLFEVGAMALDTACAAGHFRGWELAALGSVDLPGGSLELPRSGVRLQVVPRTRQSGYADLLGTFDVGLSLMYTPHPSLVPIEMASAGMVTVTNTFGNKDGPALARISSNLIGAAATVEGVAAALAEAEARVDDLDARFRGSRVDWPASWDVALDENTLGAVESLL